MFDNRILRYDKFIYIIFILDNVVTGQMSLERRPLSTLSSYGKLVWFSLLRFNHGGIYFVEVLILLICPWTLTFLAVYTL